MAATVCFAKNAIDLLFAASVMCRCVASAMARLGVTVVTRRFVASLVVGNKQSNA